MAKIILFLNIFILTLATVACDKSGCTFTKHKEEPSDVVKQLDVLKGHSFRVMDNDGKYRYDIAICEPIPGSQTGVGVLQQEMKDGHVVPNTTHIVGLISDADIISGTDWLMLIYGSGESYHSHCMKSTGEPEQRKARIMFICDPASTDVTALLPNVVDEVNDKFEECYYLFEINTAAVCKLRPLISIGMSTGSILLIVLVCVAAFYLLAGVLYKRITLKAKGLEQIPNIDFWKDFGNLEADGCDLVCRCSKRRGPREYKGIGDEQLGEADFQSPDDGLLPM
ncbi:cation-dependent mannose-6-phosphate receptor-like [Mya arenaria]|uniref:cation-dependent mannose-6-phosphate receptor-like n=1 Tax=Mya arenaria TaxID=6604 RepID=UPI0022E1E5AA|nr:cation-dependent mannose-6-phosphate receptor-like [Mya arenaria]